ncbi:MAG TPA: tail fiber protein [Candidatus Aphodousia gallistercoris]|nr:tail fiber protein [Candidatus Aphodousia gallistercoris]
MATNELLRFANGTDPNVIAFAEWKNLPEVTKGFVAGIARSANMNRVIAQGALAGYVMGQAIVSILQKDAKLDSSTFYEDFLSALATYIPANVANGSIPTTKLQQLASYQDIEAGTASKVVCSDVLLQYLKTLVPTGTCQCMMLKTAPAGWMVMDNSQVDYEDAPELVELLWQFDLTKGDSSTYAVLPNMNGRVFQGTTTVADVCKYLEAQLPNIQGTMGDNYGGVSFSCSGALSSDGSELNYSGAGTNRMTYNAVQFKASNSNAIYSASTVQQNALQVLACVRY